MKETELIRTLRRQAIDDDVGAVCCRPQEKAADYFDLALGLAPMPAREKNLLDATIPLLRASGQGLSYDSWSRLFDIVDEWVASKTVTASLAKILREQAAQAVRRGDFGRLKNVVDLHFQCEEVSPRSQPGFITSIIKDMIQRTDTTEGAEADQKSAASNLRVILDALEKEGVPEGHGRLVLQIVRKSLPADGSSLKLSRFRYALQLLDQIGDRSLTTQSLSRTFRDSVIAADGKTEALRPILIEARELFTALNASESYGEVYRLALDTIAATHPTGEFTSDVLQLLEAANTEPTELHAILSFRGDVERGGLNWVKTGADSDAAWRDLVLAICRDVNPDRRRLHFRHWLLQRLRSTLASNPTGVADLVRVGTTIAGDPFPARTEMRELISWSAGLAELDGSRVRALGLLAGGGPVAESARLWCETGEEIGGKLRAVDNRQWYLIALELISASLEWKPDVLTYSVSRLRSFVEAVLMANPGFTSGSERIVRCRRDILNGSLLKACLHVLPKKDPAVVSQLYAAGLGIGMTEDEILALR